MTMTQRAAHAFWNQSTVGMPTVDSTRLTRPSLANSDLKIME